MHDAVCLCHFFWHVRTHLLRNSNFRAPISPAQQTHITFPVSHKRSMTKPAISSGPTPRPFLLNCLGKTSL